MAPKKEGKKPPRKPRFQEGDRVLCFHGPFLYKAECKKVSVRYRKVKYQVRYLGVKERAALRARVTEHVAQPQGADACQPSTTDWEDEWLPQSKLLKYNKANLRKLRELNRAKQGQPARGTLAGPVTRKRASSLETAKGPAASAGAVQRAPTTQRRITQIREAPSTSGAPARGRGRPPRRQCGDLMLPRKRLGRGAYAACSDMSKPDLGFLQNAQTKVRIPEKLKPWLLDDWDMVVRQSQLFRLPAKKNVDSILEDYERLERLSGNASDTWLRDVRDSVAGIKAYFDVMLGSQLLYRFERAQYAEILASLPDVPVSQIYGAPHLLRLFVKAEEMLREIHFEEQTLALLLQHLHSFLDYLANNFAALFSANEYDMAPPEYHRKAF
ncbi:mortality factor 4-like protein 1 [Dromiciops gliroides]|uniref:mortality factor 4-like protein 1 n=1 Tax=Dromiciops gliroides TaxID=33562 RepID=UPI001CC5031D|nr:mortality factor 4-like protein 1 [Dromiciops gliroides]